MAMDKREWHSRIVAVVNGAGRPLLGREVVEAVLGCPPPHQDWIKVTQSLATAVMSGKICKIKTGNSTRDCVYVPSEAPPAVAAVAKGDEVL